LCTKNEFVIHLNFVSLIKDWLYVWNDKKRNKQSFILSFLFLMRVSMRSENWIELKLKICIEICRREVERASIVVRYHLYLMILNVTVIDKSTSRFEKCNSVVDLLWKRGKAWKEGRLIFGYCTQVRDEIFHREISKVLQYEYTSYLYCLYNTIRISV